MDDDDFDALLEEEECIRKELESEREPQILSRKRFSTEVDTVPSKTRKSVDPTTLTTETQETSSRAPADEILDVSSSHRRRAVDIDSNVASLHRHRAVDIDSDVGSSHMRRTMDIDSDVGSLHRRRIEDVDSDVGTLHGRWTADVEMDSAVSVVLTQRPDSSVDYMAVVGVGGVRYYLKVKKEDEIAKPAKRHIAQFYSLTENFDQLLEKAIDIMRSKKSVEPQMDETLSARSGKDLWVEKYSPRSYTQLLSKEAINRELLSWLKLWDTVVFGKTLRGRKPASKTEENPELDEWKRPVLKLALLCGPPGVGKTTLAHVAARHCGYSVIEVNSSDDRTPEIFRQALDSGASTKFSVTGDQRPLCLVLDEIDGASQPAVDVLVQACRANPGRRGAKKGGGGGAKVHPLMRPVICICNDLYATSLRELRPLALILRMSEMETVSMGLSLLNVTSAEGMTTNLNDLSALAQRMNYDLRACLNALQFIHHAGHKDVSRMINEASSKDVQKGLYTAWSNIFSLPRPSKTPFTQRRSATSLLSERAANALRLSSGTAGNLDRLIEGLFEFFLSMRFKDSGMHKTVGAFEWMQMMDILQSIGRRSQDYFFMRYQAYIPVYFHLNFATSCPPKLAWPKASAQFRQSVQRSNQILASFSAGIAAGSRPSHRALILDILPPLVDILQPNIRPVNTQLYSVRERMELRSTVNIMIQFGVQLRQDRGPDGQYDFVLDPALDSLARFSSVRQTKAMSYAAKQLVSREIALEKMRRSELGRAKNDTSEGKDGRMTAWSIQEQAKKVRAVNETHQTHQDFFGRSVLKPKNDLKESINQDAKPSPLNNKIWFRFKAGYSNAIRRPILIMDLL